MDKKRFYLPLLALTFAAVLHSCNKDDQMVEGEVKNTRTLTVENVVEVKEFVQSGSFRGSGTPPVILPGQSVSITFNAGKGQHLAFATMYGASRDWFFAPENPGLELYDDKGQPIIGDVSKQIKLWDNGSKDDITGALESKVISEVVNVDASNLMSLSLSYNLEKSEFTLKIENISTGTNHETPFSPGVWAVSNVLGGKLLNETPFFEAGRLSNPELTPLAQMGNNLPLLEKSEMKTGLITGLSPILVVVYNGIDNPIFKNGTKDSGNGLKEIAQRGDVLPLQTYLQGIKGVKEVYVFGDSPIGPGAKVEGDIKGANGDKIAFVTMFGYSNDWFYANSEDITIDQKGDLDSKIGLYDDGTSKDQFVGAGNGQAIFGGVSILEEKVIGKVGNDFPFLEKENVLKITLK